MTLTKYYDKDTKTLSIPWVFYEELTDIPDDIKIIIFKEDHINRCYSLFNRSVDNLPKNLTHLKFGFWFNQSVDNLPNSLTHLKFGLRFNQSVDNLPNSLTHLTFGWNFNQSLENLPNSIIELGLTCRYFNFNNIPEHIHNIEIIFYDIEDYNKTIDNIPIYIKQIKINNKSYLKYFKKIPFGCKIFDEDDNEIYLE